MKLKKIFLHLPALAAYSYILGGVLHLLGHLLTPTTLLMDPAFMQIYSGSRTIGESFTGFSLMLVFLLIGFGALNLVIIRLTRHLSPTHLSQLWGTNSIISVGTLIIAWFYLPLPAAILMTLGTIAFVSRWLNAQSILSQAFTKFVAQPRYFFRTVATYWFYSAIVGWLHSYGYIAEHHSHTHDTLLNFSDPLRTSEHTGLTILYLVLSFMPKKVMKIGVWFFALFGTSVFIYINIISPFFLGTQLVFYPGHELGHLVISLWAWSLIIRKKI